MVAAASEAITDAPFGSVFADRMALCEFREGQWSQPGVVRTEALSLHPGAHVLHYASGCFEGLKAFRSDGGEAWLFRLDRHVARMRTSAELLCLPVPEPELLAAMIRRTVESNRDEIPPPPGALYLRPTLIGTQANIGAAATSSTEAFLYVLASPVGDYFRGSGMRALRLLVEVDHMRSTPDFGAAKTGANYAAALRHVARARREHDADQVLFCPGGDVQETGASNFLLIDDHEVVTKPVDGSYLDGVTRDSVLRLAADLGYRVTERDITADEVIAWTRRGEAALSGTAAVLAGVGTLVFRGQEYTVGDGGVGRNTRRLREALTGIQHGASPDRFGWLTPV